MSDEPAGGRPDNLFEAAPGDYDARGRFSNRASSRAPAIWLSEPWGCWRRPASPRR